MSKTLVWLLAVLSAVLTIGQPRVCGICGRTKWSWNAKAHFVAHLWERTDV